MGFNHYDDIKDSTLSDMLRQANDKTENQLVVFSDSSWQDCLFIGRSTGAYNIFYHGGQIDHGTHVPGSVHQSSL